MDNLLINVEHTHTKQLLSEAQQHLVKAFTPLLSFESKGRHKWIGTKTDLLEMAHLAYVSDTVRDEQGRHATFRWIASRVCNNLRIKTPRNPNAFVSKAMQRKNTKQAPLLERYCHLLYNKGINEPLTTWMTV